MCKREGVVLVVMRGPGIALKRIFFLSCLMCKREGVVLVVMRGPGIALKRIFFYLALCKRRSCCYERTRQTAESEQLRA